MEYGAERDSCTGGVSRLCGATSNPHTSHKRGPLSGSDSENALLVSDEQRMAIIAYCEAIAADYQGNEGNKPTLQKRALPLGLRNVGEGLTFPNYYPEEERHQEWPLVPWQEE